jgi:gamma-butyrobetaine dioxygenase
VKAALRFGDSTLEIAWPEGDLRLSLSWLRANCACAQCRTSSGQRLSGLIDHPPPELAGAELTDDGARAVLRWSEGHVSEFAVEQLAAVERERGAAVPFGMACRRPLTLARLPYQAGTEAEVQRWLELLEQNHVVLLEAVERRPGMVLEVARRLAPTMSTIYGDSWLVTASTPETNIAYSALPLPLHQDLSAYEAPPGLQWLHCLRFDDGVQGGETMFADGLAAAESLRAGSPEAFRTLSAVWATFDKRNRQHDMLIRKPHLVVDDFGNITALNWAPPFEGPYLGPPALEAAYLQARAQLQAAIDALPLLEVRLQPSQLVVFCNRRTLHGRRGFGSGRGGQKGPVDGRVLEGCYTSLDDVGERFRLLRRKNGSW